MFWLNLKIQAQYIIVSIISNVELVISSKATCKVECLGLNPYCVGVKTELNFKKESVRV